MAELAKKLHFKKNGTEQTAKAYSTVDEVGDNYVPLKIDGVACYAPLGATNDTMATNGRVIKGGTTYAIKSQAKVPYAELSYTTAGTHTFTVPSGVTRLRVAVCGGGGGGLLNALKASNASAGGASSFGSLITATGGGGATCVTIDSRATSYGGTAGSPNGNEGTVSGYVSSSEYPDHGGPGFALSFSKSLGSYGKGGTTASGSTSYMHKCTGGGSGGYDTNYFSVTSGTTYVITVGAGGAPGTKGTYGNSGFVLIAYGGDI